MDNTAFIRITVASLFLSLTLMTCRSPTSGDQDEPVEINDLQDVVTFSVGQLVNSIDEVPSDRYPIRTTEGGVWELRGPESWTSGFFPGLLWQATRFRDNPDLVDAAMHYTHGLEEQQYNTLHHDVGFMILNSYGHAYREKGKPEYREIILQGAESLSTRYNSTVGAIQSWSGDFPVIIDNMMNLEILFWAAENGGDESFYDIAVEHAYTTLEHHVRDDGSSYQVVEFDEETGEVTGKRTVQGYDTGSAWSRGQAWGVYGYTMAYRETGDSTFLETAEKMADFFIKHLPSDYIPYWDLLLPDDDDRRYRDTSAASILLSALLELKSYVDDPAVYDSVIDGMMESLKNNYLAANTPSSGILLESAYIVHSEDPYDRSASTIWGDYYFMESLIRYGLAD